METEVAALAGWVARSVVAVALLASALWKLGHPGAFRAAVRAALPARASTPLTPVLAAALPPLEAVTAALLMISGPVSRAAALAAAGMLAAFTLVVARTADPQAGCGCWRAPATRSRAATAGDDRGAARNRSLARNAILLAAAVAGAALPQVVATAAATLLLLPAAALLALLVLELPTIGAVVAAGRR